MSHLKVNSIHFMTIRMQKDFNFFFPNRDFTQRFLRRREGNMGFLISIRLNTTKNIFTPV